jgi:hypothetical protein
MRTDISGTSTCQAGKENYEYFTDSRKRSMVQYDYRHEDGELFSTVAPTLPECRGRRDQWIRAKQLQPTLILQS